LLLMQNKVEKERGLTLLIENLKSVHPIAKITHTSGLNGSVRLRPLSRYFEDYIDGIGRRAGLKIRRAI
jgi:hypothetical protein